MEKSLLLVLSLTLFSCATIHQTLVDISGIERVEIEQDDYVRPQFYVEKFKFSNNERSIASIASSDSSLSNRQLYFLSFYQQYLTLGTLLGKKDMVKSCPSFHNVIVNHQEDLMNEANLYTTEIDLSSVQKNQKLLAQFPVLALPYSNKSDLYSYLVSKDWENSEKHLLTALNNYYETEHQEVATLCDRGVSPGYYVYENLVSYFHGDSSFHRSHDGLKALLKVPVIANMLILDNLRRQSYPNFKAQSRFDAWLMQRSNLSWFREYRVSLGAQQGQQLSAKY